MPEWADIIASVVGWVVIFGVLLGLALVAATKEMDRSGVPRTVEPEDEVERELIRLLADYGEPCPVVQLHPAQIIPFPQRGGAA